MAFDMCACHVFACAGYESDEQAAKVNDFFNTNGKKFAAASKDDRVKNVVEGLRVASESTLTNAQCIVYGGFSSSRDPTPTHMWFEWNGTVYDTMPDQPLRQVAAKDGRLHPGCYSDEAASYKGDMVGKYATRLTAAQVENIANEEENGRVG